MPNIYWLIAAQRRFLEAMQPRVTPEVCALDYQVICQRLAATFPEADAVIVRDRLHGYRNPSDRHILLVEELALAYLEGRDRGAFERLLENVMTRYKHPSEEFLCRIGRYGKDRGKEAESQNDQTGARRFYEDALSAYQRAFALRENYYPGINIAGLQLVLGRREEARSTAKRVLASLDQPWPPEQEHWLRLTRADAHFLAGNDAEAERLYEEGAIKANPHARATARAQVEMLLKHAPEPQRAYWTPEKLDKVFNPPAAPPEAKKE